MSVQNPKVKFGYEEYCLFPDDGNRHEIINGLHYMNPAPTPSHQSISKWLQHFLFVNIELEGIGKVFCAPIDVQFGDHDIVQPDLIVILNESKAKITRTRVQGPPDLIVEILSTSTAKNDLTLKRRLYEQSGVPEYWVVDPDERSVDALVLEEGVYRTSESATSTLKLAILPDVTIAINEIFDR